MPLVSFGKTSFPLTFHSKSAQRTTPRKKNYECENRKEKKTRKPKLKLSNNFKNPKLLQEKSIPRKCWRRKKKKKGTQTDKIFCNNFQNPHKFPQSPVEKQHFPSPFHSKTTEKSMPMNKIEGKRGE